MRLSKTLAGLVPLLFVGLASAQTPPVIPPVEDPVEITVLAPAEAAKWKELSATVGRITTLTAGGKTVRWELIDEDGADLVPAADGKTAAFTASKAGTFRVLAYRGLVAAARIKMVATGAPAPPPGPVPLTAFQTKIKAALAMDKAPADAVAKYAGLWDHAGKVTVYDARKLTPADVLGQLQADVKGLGLPVGCLNATARVVADELNPLMPTAGALTTQTRDAMGAVFTRIAADLVTAGGSK